MKRLYIDIDGVLLTKRLTKAADGAVSFIEFATSNFDCYWLTTHCKGNSETVLNYLKLFFDSVTLRRLQKFKPTNRKTLKTEALEMSSDFYWLDDSPLNVEIELMRTMGKSNRLILVDLDRQNELEKLKIHLTSLIRSKPH